MIYRCRCLRPIETAWRDVEADSPEDAAQAYQDEIPRAWQCVVFDDREAALQEIRLVLVDVEGRGEWVSRSYWSGIFRRGGGVTRRGGPSTFAERLAMAAERLGWTRDPAELGESGWDGEAACSST